MLEGHKVTRLNWRNRAIFGLMKDGFLMLHKADDIYYNWILSIGDIEADDWIVLLEIN